MDIKRKRESAGSGVHLKKGEKVWITSYGILFLIFLASYLLLRLEVFNLFGKYQVILQKVSLGGIFTVIILTVAKITEALIQRKSQDPSNRYNLIRFERLVSAVLIAIVLVSILFANWYAAAVSLGLISLILGFALQTPISSFIGWVYIVIRAPYRVGDRIQVDTFTGDVVEINYLDTTLWEFAGDYLTSDLPSGRLIRFPNSLVFQSPVYNYSWKKFPFIWNEIPFHVAYESDLHFVESTIKEETIGLIGENMSEHVKRYKELLSETPVDDLEIKEYPFVCIRTNVNTWVEVLVIYLVEPRRATATRTQLIKKIITALLKQPDRVMFPKSNAR